MKKSFSISPVCFEKFFQPLQDIYKWNIEIKKIFSARERYYTIESEEPIVNEIKAAMLTQIAYSKEVLKQIKDGY